MKIQIKGMTCNHCVAAVKQALESVPGVESAEVRLDPGEAEVCGEMDAEGLLAAVREEGYEARVA